MSLPEVEEFLKKFETSDQLSSKNGNSEGLQMPMNLKRSPDKKRYVMEKDDRDKRNAKEQPKLKFNGYNHTYESINQSGYDKRKDVSDFTLPNDSSFSSFDTERFMSEFKPWTPSFHQEYNDSKINILEQMNCEDLEKLVCPQQKEIDHQISDIDIQNYVPNHTDFSSENKKDNNYQYLDASLVSKFTEDSVKSQIIASSVPVINQGTLTGSSKSCQSTFQKSSTSVPISNSSDNMAKKSEFSNNMPNTGNNGKQNLVNTGNNGELRNQRPQRLLTLSDFWNQDSNKSHEEQLRIKLEEERFRREHCEQLIQELQKKLLEQQEKIAVAIRVDNEKNLIISQFQMSWKKMKQKFCELETEREGLQKILKNISEKHEVVIVNHQEEIKKYKEELSKALNLATGYKEKSDYLVQEKVDLIKSHADELENYKSLIRQAENRYEELKVECQKLLEKNQQTDETLKTVQQDLNKELLKGGEVRSEMAVIHKALDACEAELTILRQEKDNLQLKLKEEANRNSILEQGKVSLTAALDEAKKAEKAAKNEVKTLTEQQEKLRAELRDVYQKQVDDVVKAKLQEFQTQLDAAEMIYQNEIETKQRAIAECAARKIKSVIDKHQLEINLVEEKHKEEKRLYEIKIAQAMQKSAMLETQLNSYRMSKNQLVEQIYSMMQKQWQQALLIISGGNGDSLAQFQKINVEKLFEVPSDVNLDLVPNHCSALHTEPMKLESQKSTTSLQNVQTQDHQDESLVTLTSHDETPLTSRKESKSNLRKYIKMILDMQQSREEYSKPKFFNGSPPSSHKDKSSKQSLQKDVNTSNEGSSTWQPPSEISIHDTSEYLSVPQKFSARNDQQKQKPPWK